MAAIELYSTPLYSDANLVAYYRLESGALTTDSKGSYTLTNINSVADGTGKFGGGADFGTPNTTKKLSRTADALGIGGDANMTVSLWVNLSAQPPNAEDLFSFFCHFPAYSRWMRVGYYYTGGVRSVLVNAASNSTTYNVTLNTGTWYHLVFVRTGTTNIQMYLNGSSVQTCNIGSSTGGANALFSLGSWDGANALFQGVIDDVAIFNRVLTATEIDKLYNGTWTSIKKVGGVAYASIKKISGVAIASVKKVGGVA